MAVSKSGPWQPQKSPIATEPCAGTSSKEQTLVVEGQGRHRATRRWGLLCWKRGSPGRCVLMGGGGEDPCGGRGADGRGCGDCSLTCWTRTPCTNPRSRR